MSFAKPFVRAVFGAALLLFPTLPVSAAPDANILRVLELTNVERQKAGLPPLVLSSELNAAAQDYSVVLATTGCWAHTCGPVPDMADRIGRAGYQGWTAIAENIAAGYPTPEAVVEGWMSSPGHRQNPLNPAYQEIGIGVAAGGDRFAMFWTQNFGARRFMPQPTGPAVEVAPAVAPPAEEAAPPEEEPTPEE